MTSRREEIAKAREKLRRDEKRHAMIIGFIAILAVAGIITAALIVFRVGVK